jgi:hypothetical protein
MFHRMESCGLKGTWCQRYDRLKMWKSTIFSNINYTLGDVTVLESFFFFFFGSIKVWTQGLSLLGTPFSDVTLKLEEKSKRINTF